MKTITIAALVSTALVAPMLYLELRNSPSAFPYPLFVVLWLLPAIFLFAAAPLIRSVKAGESVLARPFGFSVRIGVLLLVAIFWAAIVNDQTPCFLGVPNCD